MTVRLTQIDGKLPNLALMKLARFHRDRGDAIHFTKAVNRDMLEPAYERVYGSAIFNFSAGRVAQFRSEFPDAIVGGTWNLGDLRTVEDEIGETGETYDYSIYPNFTGSIGFTQRGCRLKCGFCVVPKKEGSARSVSTIDQIWRGEPWPRTLHLLDNDFFGQPRDQWEARLDEIRTGGFKVCLNQGINIRMIDEDSARALASIPYYDDSFRFRRLFTAWDNIGDEARFIRGVNTLERHGIPPSHLIVYMLVGYDKRETWERLFYRFNRMVDLGMFVYPMPYGDKNRTLPLGGYNGRIEHKRLADFQRWVIKKYYQFIPFEQYDVNPRRAVKEQLSLEWTGAENENHRG
jgi:hypothetical protein